MTTKFFVGQIGNDAEAEYYEERNTYVSLT